MSKSRAKGTAAETKVSGYLVDNGYAHVERRALGGARDRGDIAGIPGLVIEVKDVAQMQLSTWVNEAEIERENDGADVGVVWHKRRGKGSPGDWYVTMTGADFVQLLHHFTGISQPPHRF